ncbi:(2Fe-2S) ferredoxin domain-containing protein [Pseudonocardia sp. TRM90224]|uniref:(2Fe-2S) ferredoxin domain-containing protein n=1 Tax=Pseudonocardia sp. TRM90224 TaxID=2812678 RepID=UPI001E3FC204|nr:(2Fe-2S) ferredoxin domain-containing protein [Pseudonocardia sp. TRM90224]
MTDRWVLLVARPTPSGVDQRSVGAIAEAVGAGVPDLVRVAYLDQAEPSIHTVLDEAVAARVEKVLVAALAVPADPYLATWIARGVANWQETRAPVALDVRLAGGLAAEPGVGAAVAELARGDGEPITASPAAYRSPSWSEVPTYQRHVLVCRGPRCTAYGAGATHRALSAAARGSDTLVTPVGCLAPCNLGPLVVVEPAGEWHHAVDAERATEIITNR